MNNFNTDAPLNQSGCELDNQIEQGSVLVYVGNIKPQQHNRLYLEDIIQEFKAGLISRRGLVWNWLKLRIAETWQLYLSYEQFMAEMKPCFEDGPGLSRATFHRALQQLQKLGYIDRYHNLSKVVRLVVKPEPVTYEQEAAAPIPEEVSQGPEPADFGCDLKNETEISKMRQRSQKCDEESAKPLQEEVSSDPSNLSSKSSSNFYLEKEREEKQYDQLDNSVVQEEEVQEADRSETKVKSKPPIKLKGFEKDKNSAPKLQKESSEEHWALQYDGNNTPWLNPPQHQQDVNFNEAFLLWHGERFMKRYEKPDVPSAVADFEASLLNKPYKVPVRWKEYERYLVVKLGNVKMLVENGMSIREDEKQLINTHLPVLSRSEQVKGLLGQMIPQTHQPTSEMKFVGVEMPDFKSTRGSREFP